MQSRAGKASTPTMSHSSCPVEPRILLTINCSRRISGCCRARARPGRCCTQMDPLRLRSSPVSEGRKTTNPYSDSYRMGAIKSTVRTYLNSSAVRTTDNFGYNEDSIYGIDWLSSYSCTPGNMMGVSAPLLVMGMTGGYEFLAAEIIYEITKKIADKTIAFVEGATHNFDPARDCEAYPGQFGDTIKTMFDYVDKWLSHNWPLHRLKKSIAHRLPACAVPG